MRGFAFLLAIVGVVASAGAQERPPPVTLEVPSLTLSDSAFLQGDIAAGEAVVLTGQLQLPAGEGIFPAVIILHGSGGAGGLGVSEWTNLFARLGIASVRLDSYTARGHEEIFSDQSRLGEFYAVYDAYRAADALAQHPAIDPTRIAVIGFSRGGIGALYSAMTRFQELYGPTAAPIAAHIPFYPPCNFALEGEENVGPSPIRHFHGEADDWNPLPVCKDYIDRLGAAGHDASITAYPDAIHSFDNTGSPAYYVAGEAQTSRRCFRVEEDGILLNAETDMAFSWQDSCVELGPAQQFQAAGADASRAAVGEFLKDVYRLP